MKLLKLGAMLLAFCLATQSFASTTKAWERAQALAKAASVDSFELIQPPTTITYEKRFIFADNLEPVRLCGDSRAMLVRRPNGDFVLTNEVRVFVLRSEDKLKHDVLTHEYLHYIWLMEAAFVEGFTTAHPDSEAWVLEIFPSTCPDE